MVGEPVKSPACVTVHLGDIVFVSSGGGADRLYGRSDRADARSCVVASARSSEKADRLVLELGYVRIENRGWPEASRGLDSFAYPHHIQVS